jgi:hypothetical protein
MTVFRCASQSARRLERRGSGRRPSWQGFWVRFDVALQRYAITNFEVALECLERADSPAREDTMLWGEYSFEALRSE